MKKKRPVFELKINVEDGAIVNAMAMVEHPAIESNFLAFGKQVEMAFAANDERMELLGAAMIPDQLIYRIDPKTKEEFEVFFSAETIRQIAQEYFKSGYQNNLNLNHTSIPAKSYIFQSYIVDSSKGLNAPMGIDVKDGSWIVGVKINDAKVWDDVKAGKVKGFSIEGVFEFIESKFSKEDNNDDAEVIEVLTRLNQLINNKRK